MAVGATDSTAILPATRAGTSSTPSSSLRPYVGAGVDYTLIWDNSLPVAGVPLHLDQHSIGLAAQVGVDFTIDETWVVNVDLKRAMIRSDVYAGSSRLTTAQPDPWLYAIGLRYQF